MFFIEHGYHVTDDNLSVNQNVDRIFGQNSLDRIFAAYLFDLTEYSAYMTEYSVKIFGQNIRSNLVLCWIPIGGYQLYSKQCTDAKTQENIQDPKEKIGRLRPPFEESQHD